MSYLLATERATKRLGRWVGKVIFHRLLELGSVARVEAISKFTPEEKTVIKALLEGMILKHEAKRWSSAA